MISIILPLASSVTLILTHTVQQIHYVLSIIASTDTWRLIASVLLLPSLTFYCSLYCKYELVHCQIGIFSYCVPVIHV